MIASPSAHRLIALGTLLLAIAAGGCSKGLNKVSGTVTLEGNPLRNTRVVLTPVDNLGRPASGVTDDSGRFELTTTNPNDGVAKGEYKVTFILMEDVADPQQPFTLDPNQDPRERIKAMQEKERVAKEKSLKEGRVLHPNYTKLDATPHRLKVPTDGAVKFNLKKDGSGS